MSDHHVAFAALGRPGAEFQGLETFEAPDGLQRVRLESEEVTAVCPITGQPDQYRVAIQYAPSGRCVESKTVKLYLQSFRNEGIFCEAFAQRIADDFMAALHVPVQVTVTQRPRGGVSIEAEGYAKPEPIVLVVGDPFVPLRVYDQGPIFRSDPEGSGE